MSFMPNYRVNTVNAQTNTVLRVHDLQTGAVTVRGEPFHTLNATANSSRSTILRVHDLNAGSIRVIEFNDN